MAEGKKPRIPLSWGNKREVPSVGAVRAGQEIKKASLSLGTIKGLFSPGRDRGNGDERPILPGGLDAAPSSEAQAVPGKIRHRYWL